MNEAVARVSCLVVVLALVAAWLLTACGPASAPATGRAAAQAGAAHRYRVPRQVGSLAVDDAAFAAFSRAVRADLEAELAGGALAGEPLKERLFVLSLLDALDDRWADAVTKLDRIAALEDQPAAKAMRGLTIRIWADAAARGGDRAAAFGSALEHALATLPIDLVHAQLSSLRTMAQVFTPEQCRQLLDQEIGPQVAGGTVGLDEAHAIAFQRYAVKLLVPVAAVLDAALAGHGIAPAS